MTNVLDKYIANQPIGPVKPAPLPAFTFNSEGKIKPLDDKAKLLPSRIFGSPIEYAKDLKQDVVNIGRAAKGKANDHELGRINDVAMKIGSLALATYLFVKNPLKLSKAMEFVGFGTFFASMSLWPKLAIQAPIKARTGVDIHQKYVDSQGRKKMLHQDPQYDLTDLYSREDLDKDSTSSIDIMAMVVVPISLKVNEDFEIDLMKLMNSDNSEGSENSEEDKNEEPKDILGRTEAPNSDEENKSI